MYRNFFSYIYIYICQSIGSLFIFTLEEESQLLLGSSGGGAGSAKNCTRLRKGRFLLLHRLKKVSFVSVRETVPEYSVLVRKLSFAVLENMFIC
jgi:hypothetical protein